MKTKIYHLIKKENFLILLHLWDIHHSWDLIEEEMDLTMKDLIMDLIMDLTIEDLAMEDLSEDLLSLKRWDLRIKKFVKSKRRKMKIL